ncbi:MAG TPA: helix-turn-helix domain-containing protein [Myxococcota bacterium]|nr:helix-turn-helix domain-containing protein [Myxococcota bacterium]
MVERGAGTRERLMTAAIELFAERGFDGASVGEIERSAGLAPRSGALYQHFRGGKQELLRCAIEHELRAIDELGSVIEMLPLGDLRAEFTLLARWNLGSLERRSALARFVRRDVARLPPELRDELFDRLVGQPYEQLVQWLRGRFAGAAERPDFPALALVLVESISAYHSLRRTFARTPDSVDDERFIAAWTETALAVARRYGIDERR